MQTATLSNADRITRERAYAHGVRACKCREAFSSNPFLTPILREQWRKGYMDTHREVYPEMYPETPRKNRPDYELIGLIIVLVFIGFVTAYAAYLWELG